MALSDGDVLFYVSGHGFGHARRSAQIIAALLAVDPSLKISVRSAAPKSIFTAAGVPEAQIVPMHLDPGVVERDVLNIDTGATSERVASFFESRRRTIAMELEALRPLGVTLIVADIPFLAGDIAAELGVPCVATGNFTWDWIYEPFLREHPRGQEILDSIAASYGLMTAVLRQPFCHRMRQFHRVIDVPLIARRPRRQRDEILQQLGFGANENRRRILIGMRGGTSPTAIEAAARTGGDFLFTTTQPLPSDAPENLKCVAMGDVDFTELLSVHDAVISKLGYGIVADCIATGVRLLWPRRVGFREEELFEAQAPKYLRMGEIAREDYASGEWAASLRKLMLSAPPSHPAPLDDGQRCAELLSAGFRII